MFAREGAKVAVVFRTEDAGERMAAELGVADGKAVFIKTNVTNIASIRHMIDTTIEMFGQLDILVNNTGYHISNNVEQTS